MIFLVFDWFEELLNELGQSKVFSKLALRYGYHQVRMSEVDIYNVFKPLLRKSLLVVFYDILVYSQSMSQHVKNFQQVIDLLRADKLFDKRSVCSFGGLAMSILIMWSLVRGFILIQPR